VSPRAEFRTGIRAALPLLIGVAPFGMIYGVLALGAGLSAGVAQAMSVIVFAGSAQFVITQLIGLGTPWGVIVLTAFVVNVRHVLYSVSIAPHLRPLPASWKALLSYLLTDEAYAVAITRYHHHTAGKHQHWFFLGAGLTLWCGWQVSTAAGLMLGGQLPAWWSLDFTMPLIFIALVTPLVSDRAGLTAALTAGGVAILAAALPLKLGLVAAAIAGVLGGLAVEWRRQ
jgi:4-azaleucine resistance transporter AzlC